MNKIVIGIDQSYKDTGVSVSMNGKLKAVTDIFTESLETNTDKRNKLHNDLYNIFKKVSLRTQNEPSDVIVIIERIRLRSQGFLNIDYIKGIGALNALIVDLANDFNFPVYSVDTRAWKAQVVGTSKEETNKYGIDAKKWPTIKWCIRNGYENKIIMPVSGRKKKGVVKSIDGVQYTYNDNRADSICISLYGFIAEKQQNLVKEH